MQLRKPLLAMSPKGLRSIAGFGPGGQTTQSAPARGGDKARQDDKNAGANKAGHKIREPRRTSDLDLEFGEQKTPKPGAYHSENIP